MAVLLSGAGDAYGKDPASDTEALQAYVTAQVAAGQPIELRGVYRINDTIDFGHAYGIHVRGVGKGRQALPLNRQGMPQTPHGYAGAVLYWEGPSDRPVCRYSGHGARFEGLAIWGNGMAAIGFHLYKGAGIGTGHCTFVDLAIDGCTVGFQCGTSAEDGNCDNVTMLSPRFTNCESGYRVLNDQSQMHVITGLSSGKCRVVLDFQRGGMLLVDGHNSVRDQTILRLGNQGRNNCDFTIHMLKIDAQAAGSEWMLLDAPPQSAPARVLIEGRIAYPAGRTYAELIHAPSGTEVDVSRMAGIKTP